MDNKVNIENQRQFPEAPYPHVYKPIGTGSCWTCGEPFYKHLIGFTCPGCGLEKAEIYFAKNPEIPGLCQECNDKG